jgi:hypothetical protein
LDVDGDVPEPEERPPPEPEPLLASDFDFEPGVPPGLPSELALLPGLPVLELVSLAAPPPSPGDDAASFEVLGSPAALASPGAADSAVAVSEAPSAAAALVRDALWESFFAHPLPLKWMAGVEIARLSAPPQTSQVVGPGLLMPCMTSMVRPQPVQT